MTVRDNEPQLTKHWKNDPTTFAIPKANSSLFELILYLCLRAYKSETDKLDANATIEIIRASWNKDRNKEKSGKNGFGNLVKQIWLNMNKTFI